MKQRRVVPRAAKTAAPQDQLGARGQIFVTGKLMAMNFTFTPTGDKTPSFDGYVQVNDGSTNLHLGIPAFVWL